MAAQSPSQAELRDQGSSPIAGTHAIVLSSVSKFFGSFAALRNVSADFRAGSSTVLLGPNGAGKSTLLRIIAGLSQPSRGSVTVFGAEPSESRGRISYMSHASMLYDELSAIENLRYFAAMQRSPADCACAGSPEMALRAVGLDPHLARPVGQYSQGMRQRASLARALATDPDILLLDEPFSNLDTTSVAQLVDLLVDFRTWPSVRGVKGRTIILTTHQAHLAGPLADQVLTLLGGAITASGSPTAGV